MKDLFITKADAGYGAEAGIWAADGLSDGEMMFVDGATGAKVGVAQIETATVAGTVGATGAGNATVIVTSALVTGSPLTVTVAVANDDTAAEVADKMRAELLSTAAITDHFEVSGATTAIILTALVIAANDSTLNMAIATGTATGITAATTSVATAAGSTMTSSTASIQIILGGSDGVKVSPALFRAGFGYNKQTYVAPVTAVKFLGSDTAGGAGSYSLHLPSTFSLGTAVSLAVQDLSRPVEESTATKFYSVPTVNGDVLTGLTNGNPIVRLIALINADSKSVITALGLEDGAGNIDGIQFTSNTAGKDFAIYPMGGVLQSSDIVEYKIVNKTLDAASTTAVANNVGQGTAASLAELEKTVSTRDGYMGKEAPSYLYTVSSKIVTDTTYTTYIFKSQFPKQGVVGYAHTFPLSIMLAVPAGETSLISTLDAMLALFTS